MTESLYTCGHCGADKDNEFGVCSNCMKFPTENCKTIKKPDVGRKIDEQSNEAIFYFLKHGVKEPEIITYNNIETEEHLGNMITMGLLICDKNGTPNDKIFAYWKGVWYNGHVTPKDGGE